MRCRLPRESDIGPTPRQPSPTPAVQALAQAITIPKWRRTPIPGSQSPWRRWRSGNRDFASAKTMGVPVDPYSSGVTFAGWSPKPRYTLPDGYVPLPVSPPRTTLLRVSYQQYGRIDPFDAAGTDR